MGFKRGGNEATGGDAAPAAGAKRAVADIRNGSLSCFNLSAVEAQNARL
jgi:hypothetical protein